MHHCRVAGRIGFVALISCLLIGCDGASTGTTSVAHDQDPTAGHMNHPAGGPDSPLGKAQAKPKPPAK